MKKTDRKEGQKEISELKSAKRAIGKHISVERKEHHIGGGRGKRKRGRRGGR